MSRYTEALKKTFLGGDTEDTVEIIGIAFGTKQRDGSELSQSYDQNGFRATIPDPNVVGGRLLVGNTRTSNLRRLERNNYRITGDNEDRFRNESFKYGHVSNDTDTNNALEDIVSDWMRPPDDIYTEKRFARYVPLNDILYGGYNSFTVDSVGRPVPDDLDSAVMKGYRQSDTPFRDNDEGARIYLSGQEAEDAIGKSESSFSWRVDFPNHEDNRFYGMEMNFADSESGSGSQRSDFLEVYSHFYEYQGSYYPQTHCGFIPIYEYLYNCGMPDAQTVNGQREIRQIVADRIYIIARSKNPEHKLYANTLNIDSPMYPAEVIPNAYVAGVYAMEPTPVHTIWGFADQPMFDLSISPWDTRQGDGVGLGRSIGTSGYYVFDSLTHSATADNTGRYSIGLGGIGTKQNPLRTRYNTSTRFEIPSAYRRFPRRAFSNLDWLGSRSFLFQYGYVVGDFLTKRGRTRMVSRYLLEAPAKNQFKEKIKNYKGQSDSPFVVGLDKYKEPDDSDALTPFVGGGYKIRIGRITNPIRNDQIRETKLFSIQDAQRKNWVEYVGEMPVSTAGGGEKEPIGFVLFPSADNDGSGGQTQTWTSDKFNIFQDGTVAPTTPSAIPMVPQRTTRTTPYNRVMGGRIVGSELRFDPWSRLSQYDPSTEITTEGTYQRWDVVNDIRLDPPDMQFIQLPQAESQVYDDICFATDGDINFFAIIASLFIHFVGITISINGNENPFNSVTSSIGVKIFIDNNRTFFVNNADNSSIVAYDMTVQGTQISGFSRNTSKDIPLADLTGVGENIYEIFMLEYANNEVVVVYGKQTGDGSDGSSAHYVAFINPTTKTVRANSFLRSASGVFPTLWAGYYHHEQTGEEAPEYTIGENGISIPATISKSFSEELQKIESGDEVVLFLVDESNNEAIGWHRSKVSVSDDSITLASPSMQFVDIDLAGSDRVGSDRSFGIGSIRFVSPIAGNELQETDTKGLVINKQIIRPEPHKLRYNTGRY